MLRLSEFQGIYNIWSLTLNRTSYAYIFASSEGENYYDYSNK